MSEWCVCIDRLKWFHVQPHLLSNQREMDWPKLKEVMSLCVEKVLEGESHNTLLSPNLHHISQPLTK